MWQSLPTTILRPLKMPLWNHALQKSRLPHYNRGASRLTLARYLPQWILTINSHPIGHQHILTERTMRRDKRDDPVVQILHWEWTKIEARFARTKATRVHPLWLKTNLTNINAPCLRTTRNIDKTKARPCFWHTYNPGLSYIFPPEASVHKNSDSPGSTTAWKKLQYQSHEPWLDFRCKRASH